MLLFVPLSTKLTSSAMQPGLDKHFAVIPPEPDAPPKKVTSTTSANAGAAAKEQKTTITAQLLYIKRTPVKSLALGFLAANALQVLLFAAQGLFLNV
jgi:hypothetical protein